MKPIKDYEHYMISESGEIFNKFGKRLKPELVGHQRGTLYYRICLTKDSIKYKPLVHRLVASHFIENPEGKSQVNHKDKNPLNNHVDNLEWVTPEENMQHRFNRTIRLISPNNDIVEIKSMNKFCKEYNLSGGNMSAVIKGDRSQHKGWRFYEFA